MRKEAWSSRHPMNHSRGMPCLARLFLQMCPKLHGNLTYPHGNVRERFFLPRCLLSVKLPWTFALDQECQPWSWKLRNSEAFVCTRNEEYGRIWIYVATDFRFGVGVVQPWRFSARKSISLRVEEVCIDWFWLLGWLIHKGAICTRIAPLWISTSTGTAWSLSWLSQAKRQKA